MEYYTGKKVMKYKAVYYVVVGPRSNGKTYWWCDKALDNYIDNGKQSAYIRRFDSDILPQNIEALYNPHDISKKTKGEFNGVEYKKRAFTLVYRNDDGIITKRDLKPFCYCYALNVWESAKGADKGDIDWILFDEFMTRRRYLANEFIIFQNVLSSIIRDRLDVTIFMMANTVNKYCPYFKEMGLTRVQDMKPGDIDLYRFGESGLTVAVEMCGENKKAKQLSKYYAFDNPQLKMITEGSWEIQSYPHCEHSVRKEDIAYKFYILFSDTLICGNIVAKDNYLFILYHPHTGNHTPNDDDIMYIPVHDGALLHCVTLSEQRTRLHSLISKLISEGREFYSDNTTGEVIRNWKINQLHMIA